MAADTENKRASATSLEWDVRLPQPDGSIVDLDRAQALGLYALEGSGFTPVPAGAGRKKRWLMGLPHWPI